MTPLTLRECITAVLAFAAGLLLLALVNRPCPPSPRPTASPETPSLDTDADASGDLYGEYYR